MVVPEPDKLLHFRLVRDVARRRAAIRSHQRDAERGKPCIQQAALLDLAHVRGDKQLDQDRAASDPKVTKA